jgi:hypothetical protein
VPCVEGNAAEGDDGAPPATHDAGRLITSPGSSDAKLPSAAFVFFCGFAATSSGQRRPSFTSRCAIFVAKSPACTT